jgi:WD40 repeat protein
MPTIWKNGPMILRSPRKLTVITLAVVWSVLFAAPLCTTASWDEITFVAWHPNGTLLAVGHRDTVQIIDTTTMQVLNVFSGLNEQVTAPAWSPDGNKLAIANGPQLDIWQQPWDPNAAQLVLSYSSNWRWLYALAWSPDADKIAVGDVAVLEVWDVSGPAPELLLSSEPGGRITDMVWSPSGALLANTSLDHRVLVWDITTGNLLSTLRVLNDPVTSFPSEFKVMTLGAAWSPDGTRLAIACEDGTIRLWDRTTTSEPETISYPYTSDELFRHDGAVWAVDWSSDGRWIASGGADGTVHIWDVNEGKTVDVIQVGGIVRSVAWSPDSTRLAYGGENGTLEIVNSPLLPVSTPTETPTPTAVP